MDFYVLVFFTKVSDSFPLMPPGTIYPQINNFILKMSCNMREKVYKTVCIAFFVLHYAMSTIYRIPPNP